MKCHRHMTGASRGRRRQRAVTVVELMVSVTLISFIILSLYQMFARTQEQMRRAMRQVDTLESGRAVMNVMQRDLGLMSYPDLSAVNPAFMWSTNWASNFVGRANIQFASTVNTNVRLGAQFDRFFMNTYDTSLALTNYGGVGYHIGSLTNKWLPPEDGIGTLYRYSFYDFAYNRSVWNTFRSSNFVTFCSRLIDNVVHFRVNPYPTNSASVTGLPNVPQVNPGDPPVNGNIDDANAPIWSFTGRALPQLVEIELGYVDEETAAEARALLDPALTRSFIAARPEKISLFRFLVPIRVASEQ